jgi:hypothetical protein
MPCMIGIATKPERKQVYWRDQVASLANWQILNSFRSRAAAKEYETAYAMRNGCEEAPDDYQAPRTGEEYEEQYDWWYVYHFDYTAETA